MSTTECITQTSLSPTKAANVRRPLALGDTSSFGTPTGSACIAAAPSSAPSAPPRHSTPCTRPSANRRTTSARTPSTHQRHGRAARAGARCTSAERVAAGRGHLLAGRCRPRTPARRGCRESITTASTPQRLQPLAHVRDLVALGVERADQGDGGHQTVDALAAERRAQVVDRLLRVAVVVGLGHGARRVVAQELLHPGAAAGLGRVADLGRSEIALRSTRGDELGRHVALVADRLPARARSRPSRARRGREACGCCRRRGSPRAGRRRARIALEQVGFLDVHVERVEGHAAVAADRVGQRQRLLAAVQEVRLEAVERLQPDPHADRLGVRLALACSASTHQRHSSAGEPIGAILPTVDGTTVTIWPPSSDTNVRQSLTYSTLPSRT